MMRDFRHVGIKGINIAFRAPIDWDALQQYIEEVMPGFRLDVVYGFILSFPFLCLIWSNS